MERGAWTEERLDDLAEAMRSGFARVDQDIRDLRSETREEFRALRGEMNTHFETLHKTLEGQGQRFEGFNQRFEGFNQRIDGLNERIDGLNQRMVQIGAGLVGSMIVGFLGVLAAILARG